MSALTAIPLTDLEIALLDPHDGDDDRPEDIELAKARIRLSETFPALTAAQHGLIALVVRLAKRDGRIRFQSREIVYCPVCKRDGGYVTFQTGPNRGFRNYKKPLTFAGIEFRYSMVNRHVNIGGCTECVAAIRETLLSELEGVRADLPEALTGYPSRYTWFKIRSCYKCDWEGGENEMGRTCTLLGNASICPECGAESTFGGSSHPVLPGFVLVEVAQ